MTPIKLFSSDLDGTLLGHSASAHCFKQNWEALSPGQRPLLCYNSGRLVDDVLHLLETAELPSPDYIIGGLGTQLYEAKHQQHHAVFDQPHFDGWDLAKVEQILTAFPGVSRQPPQFLHSHKSSWYLPSATTEIIGEVRNQLAVAGLEVSVIYSSARDLDILPAKTSKGHALQRLCQSLGLPLEQVLVAGNTGNDTSMFLLPDVKGMVVGNAEPELCQAVAHLPVYAANRAFAGGVLEGLAHFTVIPARLADEYLPTPASLDQTRITT